MLNPTTFGMYLPRCFSSYLTEQNPPDRPSLIIQSRVTVEIFTSSSNILYLRCNVLIHEESALHVYVYWPLIKYIHITTNLQLLDFVAGDRKFFLYVFKGTDLFSRFCEKSICPRFWRQKNKISPLTLLMKLSYLR